MFGNIKAAASEKSKYRPETHDKRLQQPYDSSHRMEDVCLQILESISEDNVKTIGYHLQCLQNFTEHLDRLKFSQPNPSHPYHDRHGREKLQV